MQALLHAISGVLTLIFMGLIGCYLAKIGWINKDNKALLPKLVTNVSLPLFFIYNITHAFSHDQLLHLITGSIVPFISIDEINLLSYVKEHYQVIDRDSAKSPEERLDLMRKALLCDTFLMSSNAISEDGQLVNIDGNGNRVAAMIYGPKNVIIIAGMNKVVKTLDDAYARARNIAAPSVVQRFPNAKTPCNQTGACHNCLSSDSCCAYMVTTRICRPAKKIKVILVGENLGL